MFFVVLLKRFLLIILNFRLLHVHFFIDLTLIKLHLCIHFPFIFQLCLSNFLLHKRQVTMIFFPFTFDFDSLDVSFTGVLILCCLYLTLCLVCIFWDISYILRVSQGFTNTFSTICIVLRFLVHFFLYSFILYFNFPIKSLWLLNKNIQMI